MGAQVKLNGQRGRGRGVPRYHPMAEINMTPFIDVMLVLLIIFMVAAPLLVSGVPIDLPKTAAGSLNIEQKPLIISVKENGALYLADKSVSLDQLLESLHLSGHSSLEERIYIRADKKVAYGEVAAVIAYLTQAGYRKVALVTQQEAS